MKLQPRSILLLAIDAFGGEIGGKTLLQKRLYFTEVLLHENLGLNFDAHYYGPYSANINGELTTLKLQGQLQEDASAYGYTGSSGFEMRRYCYALTAAGKAGVAWLNANYPDEARRIALAAKRVAEAGNLDYVDLSFAAKAHWILRQSQKSLTDDDIAREAARFGWKVQPDQMRRGVKFLVTVDLASQASNTHSTL